LTGFGPVGILPVLLYGVVYQYFEVFASGKSLVVLLGLNFCPVSVDAVRLCVRRGKGEKEKWEGIEP
jgi:hypothetical protein